MRKIYALVLIVLAAAVVSTSAQTGWGVHGRDAGGTRLSPLTQLTPENVSQLTLVWSYDTLPAEGTPNSAATSGRGRGAGAAANAASAGPGAPGAAAAPAAPAAQGRGRGAGANAGGGGGAGQGDDASGGPARARQSAATPLVVGDVLYLSTAYNNVVALDSETGREIWVADVGHAIATRGMAYWPGMSDIAPRLIFGTTDGWLVALDARTGAFAKGFGQNGLVDMRQGIVGNASGRVALSSPPVLYRHIAITGAHSQEAPSFGPSGDLRGWDLRTGKLVWQFHTIPRPGEKNHEAWQGTQWVDRAGANTWGLMTVDEERGIVYAPTGTPPTDFYGADRLGSNLYGSSLLALDAMTGELRWFFQTTHHDNWDYDLTSPPALIDVKRDGRTIPAVAQYSKQGLLFIFNRLTGEPIFGVEERPVVSDNPLPGDVYWPTQPFPLKPVPLARMTFSPNEVATVTPEHEKYCRALLDLEGGAMTGGPYAQYGPKLRVIFPGWTGGGNWSGGAFFPDLGYYVIPTQDLGMLNKMVQSPTNPNMYVRRGPDNAPPGLGTNFWDGQKGWPCQQPPWGELIAVNVNTGEVAWRTRLGSFEELDQKGVAATGTPLRGGPIVTATGLVFIAASQDAKFRAFDIRTGKVLWTAELSENGRTVPITYEGRSGRQYVAVLAGGGNPVARKVDPSQIGGRLHVYALPDATDTAGPVARRISAPRLLTAERSDLASASVGSSRVGAPTAGRAALARSTVPAGPRAVDFSAVLPAGPERDLVGRVCTECHDLGDTLSLRQSRARWQAVVSDMVSRGAQAGDWEMGQIVDYLSRNFGARP